jgi:hypothetical protein
MARHWYYRRGDQTRGPLSAQELRELAARGELRADDRVWAEGFDPDRAVPAGKLLQFAAPPAGDAAPLDWLGDVRELEQLGPEPLPLPAAEGIPDWVEELRSAGADQEHGPRVPAGPDEGAPASPANLPVTAAGAPDWVEKLDVPPPLARRITPPARRQPTVLDENGLEILESPVASEGELEILEPLAAPEGGDVELLEAPEGTDVELVEPPEGTDLKVVEPPPL